MQVYVATGNNYKVPPEYTECQLQRSTTVDECGLPDNYVSKLMQAPGVQAESLKCHHVDTGFCTNQAWLLSSAPVRLQMQPSYAQ